MQVSIVNVCYLRYLCYYSKDTAVVERDEQAEFESGPLSVLMQSVKQNTQVSSILFLIANIIYFLLIMISL